MKKTVKMVVIYFLFDILCGRIKRLKRIISRPQAISPFYLRVLNVTTKITIIVCYYGNDKALGPCSASIALEPGIAFHSIFN